jgi:hypothetical protein
MKGEKKMRGIAFIALVWAGLSFFWTPAAQAQDSPARMAPADADKDRKLSREEFLANAEKRFDKMDADGDGFLTTDERKQAKEKMMERRDMQKQQKGAEE